MAQFLEKDLRTGNPIQSTIIITATEYHEVLKNVTSQELENWYKNERRFTLNCGRIIMVNDIYEGAPDKELEFDFRGKDYYFKYLEGKTRNPYIEFSFPNDDNPELDELVFDVSHYDKGLYSKMVMGLDMFADIKKDRRELDRKFNVIKNSRPGHYKAKEIREQMIKDAEELKDKMDIRTKKIEEELQNHADSACDLLIRFMFSLMCYFVQNRPQEVGGETKDRYIRNANIKTSYRHNGKVNVLDNRVYKLKTSLAEKKEFMRHIGRWVVRGHWRQYKNDVGIVEKTVWIQEYLKGEGRLAKREYVFESGELKSA